MQLEEGNELLKIGIESRDLGGRHRSIGTSPGGGEVVHACGLAGYVFGKLKAIITGG